MDLKEKNHTLDKITRHPWEIARFKVIFYFLRKYSIDSLKNKGFVLDVGCGDTFSIEQLSASFPHVSYAGYDPGFDKNELEYYKKMYENKNVLISNKLNDIKEIEKKYDIILMLDVIEHVSEECNFIKDI